MDEEGDDRVATVEKVSIGLLSVDIRTTARRIIDMTAEASSALVRAKEAERDATLAIARAREAEATSRIAIANAEVAKATAKIAIPAQEETKRSRQVSYRQYVATAAALVLAVLAWAAGIRDENLVRIWIALATLAAAERTVTTALAGRRKSPELPPKSDD